MWLVTGLFPLEDSFDLLQADYIRSFGFNGSFVTGFATNLQGNALNHIYMSYCIDTDYATCEYQAVKNVICKVPCKYPTAKIYYKT